MSVAPLPPLTTATWVDETLVAAREAKKLVAVRFGRTGDVMCRSCDAMLRKAVDVPEMESVLSIYTVDVSALHAA